MHDTQHRTSPPGTADSLRQLVDQALSAWEPAFDLLDDAWSSWAGAAGGLAGRLPRRRPAGHSCGCEEGRHHDRHRCDHCDCTWCAEGADAVIEARVGERRVLPVTLHNPRHRSTTVTLVPGGWTSRSEDAPQITTEVVPGGEITLAPCETRVVRLVISVGSARSADDKERTDGDVRCCAVAICDLRVEGCDTCLRLAVAVLPSDCGSLEVDCCGCGCGC